MQPLMLCTVGPERLDEVWPQAAPLLNKALETSDGELDLSQLRLLVATGAARLVLGIRDGVVVGAAAVEFVQYPNYRVASVIAIGGVSLLAGRDVFQQLRVWAKTQGASKLQGYCSEAVARLWRRFGMEQTYIVVRCDL